MPRAPRQCGHQDCTALAYPPGRYCDNHHRENIGWNKSPRTASSGRTSSRAWQLTRVKVLQRDRHTCQIRGPRCLVTASQVDHVVPVYRGGTDDMGNLRAVCIPCHNEVTAAQARAARG
jgi:5-methylcytosine-specific restriction protein A